MDSLIHDFSGAVRHLRRNLRFVVVAVLIRGRPRSIVASRSFVDRYWPGQNAVGKRVGVDLARMGLSVAPQTWWMTVVGVADDVRYAGLEAEPTVDVYYPQSLFPQAAITG